MVLELVGAWTLVVAAGAAQEPAPAAYVPVFANATCPIMGKPASTALFVDTAMGRIFVCCTPCNRKVLDDVEGAYKAAYPRADPVENATCPVSGRAVPEGAPTVQLQGTIFRICSEDCRAQAVLDSQIVLAKVRIPSLKDEANPRCPLTGLEAMRNVFIVIGDRIVRLSSRDCVDLALRDPGAVLKALGSQRVDQKPARAPDRQ
jgi:hypothetical protein